MSTTATPLLQPHPTTTTTTTTATPSFRSQTRRLTTQATTTILRHRRLISDQSIAVRESAAQQIETRQSEWAYSTPIVTIDLIWNTFFVFSAVFVLIVSRDEVVQMPLRLWIVGYGVQCVLHMVCVVVEYKRRRDLMLLMVVDRPRFGSGLSGVGSGLDSGSNRGSYVNSGSNRESYVNSGSNSSSEGSFEGESMEFVGGNPQNEDNTSAAKHLESANTMFSFIWWIIGFYWVSSGGPTLADDAPKLYWLTITFLAFDVFFVVICVVVACIIGIAVCCCLPCIIAILYAVADPDGATREDIDRLPKYKFRSLGQMEKKNGEIQESFGGIMTECDTDTPMEHALSAEEAECAICLTSYEDGCELRELPCLHHFHCACIDKWLHINAICPLCKYNILKNGRGSSEEV